jgi:four helix bundle protein
MEVFLMTINRFEDLVAWQRARQVVKNVYQHTQHQSFHADFALRDQVRRSAISIMANIAEGFHRWNRNDFLRFLQISIASACETKSHFYVAFDLGYISEIDFHNTSSSLDEIARLITGLMTSLRRKLPAKVASSRTKH